MAEISLTAAIIGSSVDFKVE